MLALSKCISVSCFCYNRSEITYEKRQSFEMSLKLSVFEFYFSCSIKKQDKAISSLNASLLGLSGESYVFR